MQTYNDKAIKLLDFHDKRSEKSQSEDIEILYHDKWTKKQKHPRAQRVA